MIARLLSHILSAGKSDFGRNAIWFTGLSAFERVIALAQTILISRALGITEYGVYGLLFGTIGLIASVAGLQMGLTATVFVAKFRESEKLKAAAVISIVQKFGWIVAAIFVLGAVPFSELLSSLLLGPGSYQVPILLGIIFVAASIVSGVQDGVAQGFEIFGPLAKLKVATSALALALIFPAARNLGLNGVLCVILAGLLLKFLILGYVVRRKRKDYEIPNAGAGVSFLSLVSGFAFPSMVVSLAVGFVTWLGMFLLSKQPAGFDGVAIANTGLQWRGPVLLLAASLGGVAVPVFSRLAAHGDSNGSNKLRSILSLLNLVIASGVAIVVIAGSGLIMKLYGSGFEKGRFAFSLIVLSTIPMVVANVYMQQLVGAARMWRQAWLQVPFLAVMGVSFILLVPRYHAVGYSISLLLGSTIFLGHVLLIEQLELRKDRFRSER